MYVLIPDSLLSSCSASAVCLSNVLLLSCTWSSSSWLHQLQVVLLLGAPATSVAKRTTSGTEKEKEPQEYKTLTKVCKTESTVIFPMKIYICCHNTTTYSTYSVCSNTFAHYSTFTHPFDGNHTIFVTVFRCYAIKQFLDFHSRWVALEIYNKIKKSLRRFQNCTILWTEATTNLNLKKFWLLIRWSP